MPEGTHVPHLYDECPDCAGIEISNSQFSILNSTELPPDFDSELEAESKLLIKRIYGSQLTAAQSVALVPLVANILEQQVYSGFGKNLTAVDFTTPDAKMLFRLTRDVWQFASAKNYQQLRDMTLALRDENGKLRSFGDFKAEAAKINDKFNKTWLRTEYNFAVNSATMASRWNEFQKNANDMPYLQYQTVGDKRVRPEHAKLNNIIRKIDDDFWKTHFPPLNWNCFKKDTKILTPNGWKYIQTIKKGDFVVSGSGKYQFVEGFHINTHRGNIINLFSKRKQVSCTPNHRFFTQKGWLNAEFIKRGDIVVQVAKVGFFNKIINTVNNMYVLLFYGFMSLIRKRKTITAHTINS